VNRSGFGIASEHFVHHAGYLLLDVRLQDRVTEQWRHPERRLDLGFVRETNRFALGNHAPLALHPSDVATHRPEGDPVGRRFLDFQDNSDHSSKKEESRLAVLLEQYGLPRSADDAAEPHIRNEVGQSVVIGEDLPSYPGAHGDRNRGSHQKRVAFTFDPDLDSVRGKGRRRHRGEDANRP